MGQQNKGSDGEKIRYPKFPTGRFQLTSETNLCELLKFLSLKSALVFSLVLLRMCAIETFQLF